MDSYKIIGLKHSVLTFKDGNSVSGYYLYMIVERNGVTGYATESLFVSDAKLNGYTPSVNDIITLSYNRFGKVQSINKIK